MDIDTTTYQSPSYDQRPSGIASVSSILIHTTEGTFPGDAEWLCNPDSGVSTHYVISPAGAIYQLVKPEFRAWHAGTGSYQGCTDLNDISIGVECSHVEGSAWPDELLDALDALCRSLIEDFLIEQEWIVAHRWYAPTRRTDPTDFPDSQLKPFIANLYAPAPTPTYERTYRVLYNRSTVREGPARSFPIVAYLDANQEFDADSIKFGEPIQGNDEWVHVTNPDIGFITATAVKRVQ